MMTLLLSTIFFISSALAQSPWYFGSGEAVNLTPGIAYSNGVKNITGSLDPTSSAVNAPAGSLYLSTNGTTYVKQDSGLTTNWLAMQAGTGFVKNLGSSTDNCIPTFDSTTGQLIQCNSTNVVITDLSRLGVGTSTPQVPLHVSHVDPLTVLLDGNTGGSSPAVSTILAINSNIDYRGRGVYLTSTANETNSSWFAGVPYSGDAYQIGVSSVQDPEAGNSSAYLSSAKFIVRSDGKVGIGVQYPDRLFEVLGVGDAYARLRSNSSNTNEGPRLEFARGNSSGYPASNTVLGAISAVPCSGDSSTCVFTSSSISINSTENMSISNQGRDLRMFTTPKASTANSEIMRLDDDGLVTQWQPAPTSKSGAATLTAAEIRAKIVQYTGAVDSLTMPTGTDIDASFVSPATSSTSFDFSVVNTGTGPTTILANTGITLVGNMVVTNGSSGIFRARRTGANAYTVYRLTSDNPTVSLTSDVSGVLPVANGGSNKALTLAAGGLVWTDADSFEVTAAGSSGQLLQSNGTSAPSWSSVSLTEVMSIPGATTPEFVSYTFTAGTGSVNECTTGTCAAYAVSGTGISSVAWTNTGRYTVTFDATYAIVNCTITSWSATVGVATSQGQGSRPSCKACSSTNLEFWRGSDESFRDVAGVLNCVLIP